jgi:hypothetical protein
MLGRRWLLKSLKKVKKPCSAEQNKGLIVSIIFYDFPPEK